MKAVDAALKLATCRREVVLSAYRVVLSAYPSARLDDLLAVARRLIEEGEAHEVTVLHSFDKVRVWSDGAVIDFTAS